jgi:hypothetical protein
VTGEPAYDRTLRRLVAVDWWFGSRRLSPARFSKRHGVYLSAAKGDATDYGEVNRELYAEQGQKQYSGSPQES